MSEYRVGLVFHLLGAFSLVSGTILAGVAFEAARRRSARPRRSRFYGPARLGLPFFA